MSIKGKKIFFVESENEGCADSTNPINPPSTNCSINTSIEGKKIHFAYKGSGIIKPDNSQCEEENNTTEETLTYLGNLTLEGTVLKVRYTGEDKVETTKQIDLESLIEGIEGTEITDFSIVDDRLTISQSNGNNFYVDIPIPEVDGFIPLTGTDVGKPATGRIQFGITNNPPTQEDMLNVVYPRLYPQSLKEFGQNIYMLNAAGVIDEDTGQMKSGLIYTYMPAINNRAIIQPEVPDFSNGVSLLLGGQDSVTMAFSLFEGTNTGNYLPYGHSDSISFTEDVPVIMVMSGDNPIRGIVGDRDYRDYYVSTSFVQYDWVKQYVAENAPQGDFISMDGTTEANPVRGAIHTNSEVVLENESPLIVNGGYVEVQYRDSEGLEDYFNSMNSYGSYTDYHTTTFSKHTIVSADQGLSHAVNTSEIEFRINVEATRGITALQSYSDFYTDYDFVQKEWVETYVANNVPTIPVPDIQTVLTEGNITDKTISFTSNSTGTLNTVNLGIKGSSLYFNASNLSTVTGIGNVMLGVDSGRQLTSGFALTALGNSAMYAITTGSYNDAFGSGALASATTATKNAGVGAYSLYSLVTGMENVGVGTSSLQNANNASTNTGVGVFSLFNTTTGNLNTAIGGYSMHGNKTGYKNVALGFSTAYHNPAGMLNSYFGYKAGLRTFNGSRNIFIGAFAGTSSTNTATNGVEGNDNLVIGNFAGVGDGAISNKLIIGMNTSITGFGNTITTEGNVTNTSLSNYSGALITGDFVEKWVSINNKLGVGTKNPTEALEVVGNVKGDIIKTNQVNLVKTSNSITTPNTIHSDGVNLKYTPDNGLPKEVAYVEDLYDDSRKLLKRYIHTSNREITHTAVDYITGYITATNHGFTHSGQKLVGLFVNGLAKQLPEYVPTGSEVLPDSYTIPFEWLQADIYVKVIDANTLMICNVSGDLITVNTTSSQNNGRIDFTKWHIEDFGECEFLDIPQGSQRVEITVKGFTMGKGFSHASNRYIQPLIHSTDNSILWIDGSSDVVITNNLIIDIGTSRPYVTLQMTGTTNKQCISSYIQIKLDLKGTIGLKQATESISFWGGSLRNGSTTIMQSSIASVGKNKGIAGLRVTNSNMVKEPAFFANNTVIEIYKQ